jgi:hypothetical protein
MRDLPCRVAEQKNQNEMQMKFLFRSMLKRQAVATADRI